MYHKTRGLFYRLRVYDNDMYEYKLLNKKFKTKYQSSNHAYSELLKKDFIVIGKLATLRLLYAKI